MTDPQAGLEALGAAAAAPQLWPKLLEAGPACLYLLDFDTRSIVYLSPKHKHTFPDSFQRLARACDDWLDLVRESDRNVYREALAQIESGSESVAIHYELIASKRQQTIPVVDRIAAVRNTGGSIIGWAGHIEDESVRARTMQSLARQAWKELGGKMTRRFLHDFSNAVAGIYSLSELYSEPGSELEDMQEAMGHIRGGAVRAQDITERMRTITKQERGQPTYYDLEEQIEAQIDYIRALLPKHTDIQIELSRSSLPIRFETSQFREALLHLVDNAADAMEQNPILKIASSRMSPSRVRIVVSDNGVGIKPQNLERIFQPFFTTKRSQEHTGVGLFLARQFAEDMGGTLHAEANVETGARLAMELPLADFSETINHPKQTRAASRQGEADKAPTLLIYSWEDITRHRLLHAMREAGWKYRLHLDAEQVMLDLRDMGEQVDGVVLFASAIDENALGLLARIRKARDACPLALVSLDDREESLPEEAQTQANLVLPPSTRPGGALKQMLALFLRKSAGNNLHADS